jgi:hypothetical protein
MLLVLLIAAMLAGLVAEITGYTRIGALAVACALLLGSILMELKG